MPLYPGGRAHVGDFGGADTAFKFPTFNIPSVFYFDSALSTVPIGNVFRGCLHLPAFGGPALAFTAFSLPLVMCRLRCFIHRPETIDGVFFPNLVLSDSRITTSFLCGSTIFLATILSVPAKHIGSREIFTTSITVTSTPIRVTAVYGI